LDETLNKIGDFERTKNDILDNTFLVSLVMCVLWLQGYKMDDLLTSYISLMLTSMNKKSLRRKWCVEWDELTIQIHRVRWTDSSSCAAVDIDMKQYWLICLLGRFVSLDRLIFFCAFYHSVC